MLAWTAFARGELDTARRLLDALVAPHNDPLTQWTGLRHLSLLYAYRGKYSAILENLDRILDLARRTDNDLWMALGLAEKAFWVITGYGDRDRAREILRASETYRESANIYYYQYLIKVFLLTGDYDRAAVVAREQLQPYVPYQDRVIQAYRDWAAGRRDRALKEIEAVVRNTFSYEQVYFTETLARFAFELGQWDRARALLERFLRTDDGFHYFRAAVEPRVRVLLGRVYEAQGLGGRALETYRTFLNRWSDADPDLPLLQEARSRFERMFTSTPEGKESSSGVLEQRQICRSTWMSPLDRGAPWR